MAKFKHLGKIVVKCVHSYSRVSKSKFWGFHDSDCEQYLLAEISTTLHVVTSKKAVILKLTVN